jgi:hypothetical protein
VAALTEYRGPSGANPAPSKMTGVEDLGGGEAGIVASAPRAKFLTTLTLPTACRKSMICLCLCLTFVSRTSGGVAAVWFVSDLYLPLRTSEPLSPLFLCVSGFWCFGHGPRGETKGATLRALSCCRGFPITIPDADCPTDLLPTFLLGR